MRHSQPLTQDDWNAELSSIITFGSLNSLRACIEHGADVNARFENKMTPLMQAISESNADFALELVRKGADINMSDGDGFSPLQHALRRGLTKVALTLLFKGAENNFALADIGRKASCVCSAVFYGNLDVLKAMHGRGFGLDTRDGGGMTPLMMASYMAARDDVFNYLLANVADVDLKDDDGRTALMHAAFEKNSKGKIISLLARGADADARDGRGISVLDAAISGGNTTAIPLLEAAIKTRQREMTTRTVVTLRPAPRLKPRI